MNLVIAAGTQLVGGESCYDIEDFGHARKDWRQAFLRRPGGSPATTPSIASSMPWTTENGLTLGQRQVSGKCTESSLCRCCQKTITT